MPPNVILFPVILFSELIFVDVYSPVFRSITTEKSNDVVFLSEDQPCPLYEFVPEADVPYVIVPETVQVL